MGEAGTQYTSKSTGVQARLTRQFTTGLRLAGAEGSAPSAKRSAASSPASSAANAAPPPAACASSPNTPSRSRAASAGPFVAASAALNGCSSACRAARLFQQRPTKSTFERPGRLISAQPPACEIRARHTTAA